MEINELLLIRPLTKNLNSVVDEFSGYLFTTVKYPCFHFMQGNNAFL